MFFKLRDLLHLLLVVHTFQLYYFHINHVSVISSRVRNLAYIFSSVSFSGILRHEVSMRFGLILNYKTILSPDYKESGDSFCLALQKEHVPFVYSDFTLAFFFFIFILRIFSVLDELLVIVL